MEKVYMVVTAVSSMRKEPGHKNEMINQLLFGELGEQIEENGDFVKLKAHLDGYEGWCQKKQLYALEGGRYPYITRLSSNLTDKVQINEDTIILSPGSTTFIPDSLDEIGIGGYNMVFSVAPENQMIRKPLPERVEGVARMFLGTPYLWGGRSRYGIDCSGLTQVVYMLCGISLPRDSGPQSKIGTTVDFLQAAQTGDLAFFDNEEGKIVHVGLMLGNNKILHASASVRIDPIDNYGIIHRETGDRTHKLRMIKRHF